MAYPADWESTTVGELLEFKNGLNKAKRFFGHGTPIVNFMDVLSHPGLAAEDIQGCVEVTPNEAAGFSAKRGDVFFTRTSESVDEIGLSSVLLADLTDAVFSGFVLRGRPRNAKLDDQFKKYCFRTHGVRRQIVATATYTTRALTNGRALSVVTMSLPPKPEQSAIASVLGDVDALVTSLRRVISKKRDVRQAVAAQLMSGTSRLPGHEEKEWFDTAAGSIGRFRGGNGFPTRFQGLTKGEFPFFKVSDMNHAGNEIHMARANNWIGEETRSRLRAFAFPAGTIVFAKVGAAVFLERKRLLTRPSCIDNNMCGFMVDPLAARSRFVHLLFEQFRLGDIVATTALPSLNSAQLNAIPLRLPRDLAEQDAIANVMDHMDAEIGALVGELRKVEDTSASIKQELLSGRTRLAEARVAS